MSSTDKSEPIETWSLKSLYISEVSNQIADSHFAPTLNRGISWPRCHNAPDAIMPPKMKLSLSLSEIHEIVVIFDCEAHVNIRFSCGMCDI